MGPNGRTRNDDGDADIGSQQELGLTQGNQGRDLLVGGLYIRVVCDLE